jgi:hypothetical protein
VRCRREPLQIDDKGTREQQRGDAQGRTGSPSVADHAREHTGADLRTRYRRVTNTNRGRVSRARTATMPLPEVAMEKVSPSHSSGYDACTARVSAEMHARTSMKQRRGGRAATARGRVRASWCS